VIAPSSSSVEQQFAIVVHAPLPFLLVCVVVAGVIWWAVNWRYEAKIDRLTEERDRYKTLHGRDRAVEKLTPHPTPKPSDTGARLGFSTVLGVNDDGTLQISNHGENRPLALINILKLMNSLVQKTSIKSKDLTQGFLGKSVIVTGNIIEVSELMDKVSVSIGLDGGRSQDSYMLFDDDRERLLRLDRNQVITVRGTIKSIDAKSLQLIECYLIQ
jgi:hypothetical protein